MFLCIYRRLPQESPDPHSAAGCLSPTTFVSLSVHNGQLSSHLQPSCQRRGAQKFSYIGGRERPQLARDRSHVSTLPHQWSSLIATHAEAEGAPMVSRQDPSPCHSSRPPKTFDLGGPPCLTRGQDAALRLSYLPPGHTLLWLCADSKPAPHSCR